MAELLIGSGVLVWNCCEIKFCGSYFVLDREYYKTILRRQEILLKEVSPKVSLESVLITTFGLAPNEYAGCFSNVITLKQLFL